MKIAVFGLGYVGCVSAACLADLGHDVVGVDVNQDKLTMVREGRSPIVEPGLDALLATAVSSGRLTVTDDAVRAVGEADLSMVCVGTPSRPNGDLDTSYIEHVVGEIGAGLRQRGGPPHVVAIRSTLLPGVLVNQVIPALERASGRRAGVDFGVCANPEFLREGTAIADFRQPPFTVIGEVEEWGGTVVARAYDAISAPVHRLSLEGAAMVKYASNAFHALKVAFANEIGAFCHDCGIDGASVMRVFVQDRVLNVSPAYLMPGYAFGGSCLPKDLRALVYAAKHRDTNVPLLSAVLPSNDVHLERVPQLLAQLGRKRVTLLGLSFKTGTDDLRESPLVRLAERLIGSGYPLTVVDPDVSLAFVMGKNREYLERVLPHIEELLSTDLEASIVSADVVVVGKRIPLLEQLKGWLRADQIVIDLGRNGDFAPARILHVV
jgi:GDP-mannose 6-dehydrogenase